MIDTLSGVYPAPPPAARTVTLIPLFPPLPKRKRVAAYARVSVEKDAMLHSLAAQVSYYNDMIRKRPDWEYAGVYADEGLTGTSENRPEFQRLLADCRAGKIDLILVKSISRLARNTVTMLSTVRELKSFGIDVFFEKENIHSLSGDGELMLSVLASFAQEESLSVSENCRWRIRKKFNEGTPTGMIIYGYTVKNGTFTIVPEEAAVVKLIFSLFLNGCGRVAIANYLNEKHIPSPRGASWGPSMLHDMLQNEKYAGDLLLQKYITTDHLTKKTPRNRGEQPQYYVQDDHPAIIDRETFDRVQAEIARRAEKYKHTRISTTFPTFPTFPTQTVKYSFTGKIICGVCGKPFIRQMGNSGTPYAKPVWLCGAYAAHGRKGCPSRRIAEKILIPITCDALHTQEENLPSAIDRLDKITVYPDGRLVISQSSQEIERQWSNPSRRASWNEKQRTLDSKQMKE